MASARVVASRMQPRTADVTVRDCAFFTPRMAMHMWSHSVTTITPRASMPSISASATCWVRRSCTCGRRAYSSTSRASLLKPATWPFDGI